MRVRFGIERDPWHRTCYFVRIYRGGLWWWNFSFAVYRPPLGPRRLHALTPWSHWIFYV